MWDYGEQCANIILDVYRRARRQYFCGECDREIVRCEMYNRQRERLDGRTFTYFTCLHCATVSRQWLLQEREFYHWHHVAQELEASYGEQSQMLYEAMRWRWRHPETGAVIVLPETDDLDALIEYVTGIYRTAVDLAYVLEVAPGLYVPNTRNVAHCPPRPLAELSPYCRYSWGGCIAEAVRDLYPGAVFVTLVGGEIAPWSRRAA